MPRRATQDGRVMMESSDKMWSTEEGNGKPLQYSCLENPMNSMKKWKDRTLKDELPRSVGAQYATGDQWRNNSKKNEEICVSVYIYIYFSSSNLNLEFSDIINFLKKNKVSLARPIWEGNGTPLQYSCLENPIGGGAW